MPEVDNVTPEVDNATPEVELDDSQISVDDGSPEVETPAVGSKAWFDSLDPDLKENPSIKKFKDPGALAKSYVELQKMIGKDKIVVPTDKSTPEEWAAFYKKVGRPDEMTGYDVPDIEMPEEIKMREEALEAFRQKAHELGLTKKQFAELYGLQAEINNRMFTQQVEEAQKMMETTETELRKEWGAAYEKKIDNAQKVVNSFFKDKGIHPAFKVLSNDKGFVAAMSEIAEKMGEDVIAGTARITMTPQEAQREINKMMGDTKGPLFNDLHPEHSAAVDRMTELTRMAG